MPLYKVSPAKYGGFISFFNRFSNMGKMGPNCLKAALERAGVKATRDEVQQVIDSISVDPTGITWQCFVDYVSDYEGFRDEEQEYAEAFRIFDKSGKGELSREDIAYVMEKLGVKTDLKKLFDEVDANGDGVIDFDEFIELMKRKF